MATMTRILRTSKPLRLLHSSLHSYSSSALSSKKTTVRCLGKAGETRDRRICCGNGERKSMVSFKVSSTSESVISSEKPQMKMGINMASLVADATDSTLMILRPGVKRKSWKLQAQMLVERVIIDCRFFTLFAVAGSLLGSILCFIEGSILILQSYLHYFHTISQQSDDGYVVQHLIEAIDMFLVGTAMLIFGMGLYVLFVGSKSLQRGNARLLPQSNFFGLFHLKALPAWMEIQSVSQAKSKIGHAVLMILQVGVLEKFKNIPLVTGLDLACFAGAILVSSACVFLLSRLSVGKTKSEAG